jgi:hypothetical protein
MIKGSVKGGRLELDAPPDWPEGTEVEVYPVSPPAAYEPEGGNGTVSDSGKPEEGEEIRHTAEAQCDDAWLNTPEAIADWLKWFDSLEPLIMTPEEEADTEAWLKKFSDYGTAKMHRRVEDLFP